MMTATDRISKRAWFALFWVVLITSSLPVICARYPHLLDFPGHLARVHILTEYNTSQFYQACYDLTQSIVPNIIFDGVVYLCTTVFSLMVAGKIFIILSFALILSGTSAMHFALFRKFSVWPLAVAMLLYNVVLHVGLMNYYAGLGLMLWGIAMRLLMSEKPFWIKAITALIFSALIYFAHLIAFLIYLLVVCGFLIQERIAAFKSGRSLFSAHLMIDIIALMLPIAYQIFGIVGADQNMEILYGGLGWKIKTVIRTFLWDLGIVDLLTWGGSLLLGTIILAREKLEAEEMN